MKIFIYLLIPFYLFASQATISSFHWHLNNATPESGTYVSTSFSGAKLWATIKCEGDSALWDSTLNQYTAITQLNETVLADETGSIEFAFYINKFVNNGVMCEFYQGAANYILLYLSGTATDIEFVINHRGNSTSHTLTSTLNNCQDSTWYWIRSQWEIGADTTMYIGIYNDNSGEVGTLRTLVSSTTALTTFSVVSTILRLGSPSTSQTVSANYIDRITCYKGWYWWDPYKHIINTRNDKEFQKFKRFKKSKKF